MIMDAARRVHVRFSSVSVTGADPHLSVQGMRQGTPRAPQSTPADQQGWSPNNAALPHWRENGFR
jgi:hypothetical protein